MFSKKESISRNDKCSLELSPTISQIDVKIEPYRTPGDNNTFQPMVLRSLKEIDGAIKMENDEFDFELKDVKMEAHEDDDVEMPIPNEQMQLSMDKKRSKLWTFFTQATEDKARCDLCQTVYSLKGGSTTNLKKHLIKKHRTSYEIILPTPVDPEVSQEASSEDASTSKNSHLQSKRRSISTILKRPANVEREKLINGLVLHTIVKDLQPFSIVEDIGFKSLINCLEPNYNLPSRHTLSTLLDAQYMEVKNRLKNELRNTSHISLTIDGWTSRTSQTTIQAVTAHYLVNWELKTALLGCFECHERPTAENVKNELCKMLSEWEIEQKIFVCVTDNTSIMKAAIQLTGFQHFPCVAHTLNSIVHSCLQSGDIQDIIKRIKSIVEHFLRCPVATKKFMMVQEQLRPGQKALKLKTDISSRWDTTLNMLERILLLQEPLRTAIEMLHNPIENLSDTDWQVIQEIIKILKPLKQLTEEISLQSQVTVSMILAATDSVSRILDDIYYNNIGTVIAKNIILKIITEFNSRFKNCARHPILSKAALLDPRFKRLAFREESAYEYAKNNLKAEIEKNFNTRQPQTMQDIKIKESTSLASIDGDSIWREFDAITTSMSSSSAVGSMMTMMQYMEERNISRQECPLKWWQTRTIMYPELSCLAGKYLSIMVTSQFSENIFSKTGQILSDRQSGLKPKHTNRILFLNRNQRFL